MPKRKGWERERCEERRESSFVSECMYGALSRQTIIVLEGSLKCIVSAFPGQHLREPPCQFFWREVG